MSDLQGEFSCTLDKGKELLLEELGAALLPWNRITLAISANILLFSCHAPLVARCLTGLDISSAISHLSKTWGLGPQRADAVLLIATTTMEPAKRVGSEAEGKAWLDSVAEAYAQRVGISLPLARTAVPLEVLPEELP
jgi:fatty acid synthase subunit alpha